MLDIEASSRAASLVYWEFVAVFEQLPHMLFWAMFAVAMERRAAQTQPNWRRGLVRVSEAPVPLRSNKAGSSFLFFRKISRLLLALFLLFLALCRSLLLRKLVSPGIPLQPQPSGSQGHWMRGLQSNCSHMSVRLGHLRSCHYMLPCSVGWPHASWVVFVSALVCWLQVVMYAVVFTRSRLGQKVWYVMSDETQAR